MEFSNLGSGSSGNATLVRASPTTPPVLVDCGLGLRELEQRVRHCGVQPSSVAAVLITHEHTDHAASVDAWSRKYDCPIYLSRGTWHALGQPQFGGGMQRIRDAQSFAVADLQVMPFTVPHDAREPLQFRLHCAQRHLGILTDLGHPSAHVYRHLAGVHSLILECNHDSHLLQSGPYPAALKRRIGGNWGHLSNAQAAQLLARLWQPSLTQLIAAHLSETNNSGDLALSALRAVLGDKPQIQIHLAQADVPSPWLEV